MKFNKKTLQELVWCAPGESYDGIEVVSKEYCGGRRWSDDWTQVLKLRDRYFRTYYEVPATEMQDGEPYEYEPDMIELKEVYPYEETIVKYKEG